MAVSGERIVPPSIAAMPTSAQKPVLAGQHDAAEQRAERAADDQQRRQHAARGARAERDRPDHRLDQQRAQRRPSRQHAPLQQVADDVVADAERARLDQAADADHQAADGRPPHPVDRQPLEQVLAAVDQRRQQARCEPGERCRARRTAAAPRRGSAVAAASGNSGPAPSSSGRQRRRDDRGHRHRHEAARLPFEQQQLDRQQHGRDRRAEDRRHAGRRAGHQQRLALGGGEVEELGEQRADRAAGHDDRPFGAERAAGADRDRRRQRLQHRDLAPDMRLPPIRIASIASGMPWPRIFSEP